MDFHSLKVYLKSGESFNVICHHIIPHDNYLCFNVNVYCVCKIHCSLISHIDIIIASINYDSCVFDSRIIFKDNVFLEVL